MGVSNIPTTHGAAPEKGAMRLGPSVSSSATVRDPRPGQSHAMSHNCHTTIPQRAEATVYSTQTPSGSSGPSPHRTAHSIGGGPGEFHRIHRELLTQFILTIMHPKGKYTPAEEKSIPMGETPGRSSTSIRKGSLSGLLQGI